MTNQIRIKDIIVEQFSAFCPDCGLEGSLEGECGSVTFGATCDCTGGTCDRCGKFWSFGNAVKNIQGATAWRFKEERLEK